MVSGDKQAAVDLTGRTALITGAATGLGYAIAEALGAAGATIALNDLSREHTDEAGGRLSRLGTDCFGVPGDVRDYGTVQEMVNLVAGRCGAPDIVIANAGLYPNSPFLDLSEDEWDLVLDTNLKGTFLTCQAAARAMVNAGRRDGTIIVVASTAAVSAVHGWSHYCASKAAVVMLARGMALELGEYGIRVNAVLPGYIEVDYGGAHLDDAYKQAARSAVPIGRPGTPQDVAQAVLLLASPLAGFVSGAALTVDGGSSAGRVGVRPVTH